MGDEPFTFFPRGCCGQAASLSPSPCPVTPVPASAAAAFPCPFGPQGRNEATGSVPPVCTRFLCPGKAPVPSQSGQRVTPGRNPLACFPRALPTPWCVVFLSQFLQMTPVCVCHLFLSGAPAEAPAAPGGWSCLQSLSPLRIWSNQTGCTVGKEVTLLHLDFFFLKICPLQRLVVVVAVALCPLTTSFLLC